jgi:hypothetical protein
MSYQRPLNASRPSHRAKRAARSSLATAKKLAPLLSVAAKKWPAIAMAAVAGIAALIWFWPSGKDVALANLLSERGYWAIDAPAEFYVPGTINTIEVRSDGRIALHPTCKIDPEVLAKMTIQSRTIDQTLTERLNKKFDVTARMQDLVSAGFGGNKTRRLDMSFRNSSILDLSDQELLQVQHDVIRASCQEAIAWNINSGATVCQTRSALKGDLIYDITYQRGLSVEEQGKLTAEAAAKLKLDADHDRTDRLLGNGLIYGVRLMPGGIMLNTPDAKPMDCRVSRT